jgi:hypothetical protein
MQSYQTEAPAATTTEPTKTRNPKTEVLQALGEYEHALGELAKLLPVDRPLYANGYTEQGERFEQMRNALEMMIEGSREVRAEIETHWIDVR